MAEEMPVAEAAEHIALLAERFDRRPELVVVNALYPALPAELRDDDDPTVELWRRRHRQASRPGARVIREQGYPLDSSAYHQ